MHLVLEVLTAAQAFQKSAHKLFEPFGLTPAQFNVLNLLSDQPAGLRASDLARALIVDPSNVTGLLKRMKKEGWLREIKSTTDGRERIVALSAKGRSAWSAARRPYERSLAALEAELAPPDRAVAEAVLRRLAAKAAELGEPT
jgi:DNA-binding MarR family transcriptional regulator